MTCRRYGQALLFAAAAISSVPSLASDAGPIRVEIVRNGAVFQLLRGGERYVVKGAAVAEADYASVAAHGGNSVRTWGIEDAAARLDAAARHGLTVAMGLPVAAERFGMDYDDPAAVAIQRREIRTAVQRLKDHPALLFWIVGNELNLGMQSTRVFDEVNTLSQMIHAIDPNHPTTTAITAGREPLQVVIERAPSLDFISIQLYGAMALLPRYAKEWLADRPFMVTEWGPIGHWESARTPWGAPIEMDSSTKAERYLSGYRQLIEPHLDQCLGSYVFLWGQKQERTPTWYSMFTAGGESTAATDAMRRAWTGEWPANRAPVVTAMLLDGRDASQEISLVNGSYRIAVSANDPDGDPLSYRWRVKPESRATQEGGDYEAPISDIGGLIADSSSPDTIMVTPREPGAYRLFVYAYDGEQHAAHANIPFLVAAPSLTDD